MKYNFDLDMDNDNSCSLILRKIKNNSKVLEFGPAHGRMTKYLKEELWCNVSIVELDEEAGREAKKFSNYSFLGSSGNIENYYWLDVLKLNKGKFDYIIFADVLEHLVDPLKALSSCKDLLNDDGRILISIPNVSHNSVIIDLINNKFNYNEIGLLDNTHLRFFTHDSLLDFVSKAGFKVNEEMETFCAVEHSEFKNSYSDVPEEVAKCLAERKYGEVYQFVWELI